MAYLLNPAIRIATRQRPACWRWQRVSTHPFEIYFRRPRPVAALAMPLMLA
jgi:hypothetical protein